MLPEPLFNVFSVLPQLLDELLDVVKLPFVAYAAVEREEQPLAVDVVLEVEDVGFHGLMMPAKGRPHADVGHGGP